MIKSRIIKQLIPLLFVMAGFLNFLSPAIVNAVSPNLVISEVLVDGGSATQEFIELYNNSASEVNLQGYVVRILSKEQAGLRTIVLSGTLRAKQHLLITSGDYSEVAGDFSGYAGAMSETGGHVVIYNSLGGVVDLLGWGEAIGPESAAAESPPDGSTLIRRSTGDSLQDTDNNLIDFTVGSPTPQKGGVYTPAPDVCPATPEIDTVPPAGYEINQAGECVAIIQVPVQVCLVEISEISAQPNFNNQEYIEFINNSSQPASLKLCKIKINTAAEQTLPDLTLPPQERYSWNFSSGTIKNSAGTITLINSSNQEFPYNYQESSTGQVINYESGSLGGVLSDKPTPGLPNENIHRSAEESGGQGGGTALADCGPGRYRSPETNRCRNIESDESSLIPCEPGQERNPVTNRCRKVGSTTTDLVPCQEGQERNPATNRCRKIGSEAADLKPCDPGQERNPETNRCRKASTAVSGTPLEATSQPAALSPFKYKTVLTGLLLAALLIYGAYEYRTDVKNYLQKVLEKRRRGRPPG